MINKNVTKWLSNQRRKQLLTVKRKDLSELTKWIYGKKEIYHKSKKFFKIVGIRIHSNFYSKKYGIFPIASEAIIQLSVNNYLEKTPLREIKFDSVDREKVKDIIEKYIKIEKDLTTK